MLQLLVIAIGAILCASGVAAMMGKFTFGKGQNDDPEAALYGGILLLMAGGAVFLFSGPLAEWLVTTVLGP